MGGATKRSLISAYFLFRAYFLTAQSYKRMRLITRVYGIIIIAAVTTHADSIDVMQYETYIAAFKFSTLTINSHTEIEHSR